MDQILEKLVAFRTTPDNSAAIHAALNYVAEFLAQRGLHVQRFAQNGDMNEALMASTRPDNLKTPEVLLAAHIDVVPAPDSLFSLHKESDKYVGRGVMDMKCAVAAYLQVVDQLQENLADYDFAIMITSDEETGGKNGITDTKRLLDMGFVPKTVVLPDGGNDWQLETISNGYMHLTLEANGKTGHSSRPWLGDNAAARLIDTLYELKQQFTAQGPESDTLNIAKIKCDAPANQIPDYASADISLRLKHVGSLVHWQSAIDELCQKHNVTANRLMGWDAFTNDLENPFVRAYADITEAVTGTKVVGFHSYGSSDLRFFAALGIPYANSYPRGGGHHGDDEWLGAEALPQLAEIVRQYLDKVAKRPSHEPPSKVLLQA